MSDGMDLDLQGAVQRRLEDDSLVRQLIGHPARIHQFVPEDVQFPYVTIGLSSVNDDSLEHLDAVEIFFRLHVWSDSAAKDYVECKRICAALRASLNNSEGALEMLESRCVLIEHVRSDIMRDPDGVTVHGVEEFRALVERGLQDAQDTGITIPAGGLSLG